MLRIGSLFSGIGGLELGLERAGLGPTLWQVEIDPFCRRVLERHWPEAKRFERVEEVGRANLASVDIICGGFPCQDVSVAGRGEGMSGARSGLWYEFERILAELTARRDHRKRRARARALAALGASRAALARVRLHCLRAVGRRRGGAAPSTTDLHCCPLLPRAATAPVSTGRHTIRGRSSPGAANPLSGLWRLRGSCPVIHMASFTQHTSSG